jgi:hypothetical protein
MGRTIRQAMAIACEALAGNLDEWVTLDPEGLAEHVIRWIKEYALNRGVELSDDIIASELREIIRRRGAGESIYEDDGQVIVVPLDEVEQLMAIPRTLTPFDVSPIEQASDKENK